METLYERIKECNELEEKTGMTCWVIRKKGNEDYVVLTQEQTNILKLDVDKYDYVFCSDTPEIIYEQPIDEKGKPNKDFYNRVEDAIGYINKNYTKSTLDKRVLIKEYSVSMTNFSYIFKEITGYSFKKYLDKLRIEHAMSMMKHEKSLTNIAYDSGFSSYQNFTRTFKRIVKTTPAKYRDGYRPFSIGVDYSPS